MKSFIVLESKSLKHIGWYWNWILHKAFDCLEWDYIHWSLVSINFPSCWVSLISSCLTTTSTKVIINGKPSKKFSPSRAIKQGNHLSPYLFILSMEFLSRVIEDEVAEEHWDPFTANASAFKLSYLLFVDDIVLFAKAY